MSREGCLYYSQWALLLSGLYFSVLPGKLLPAQLHVRACGLSFLYFVVRDQIKLLQFGVSNLKHKTATNLIWLQTTKHENDRPHARACNWADNNLLVPATWTSHLSRWMQPWHRYRCVGEQPTNLTNWMRSRRSCGAHPSFSSYSRTSYTQCSITNNNTIDIVKK